MIATWSRHWWVMALRGLLAIIFGVLALVWPGITLAVLVLLFGAYALVDGIFSIIAALRPHQGQMQHTWALLIEGLAGIAAGVLTFLWPGITVFVLLLLIAAWAVVTGIFEIIEAIRLRREIDNEWWLVLSGVASLLFGILLFIQPGAGALALVWLIGAYAIVFGVLLLALAFRLRGHREIGPTTTAGTA